MSLHRRAAHRDKAEKPIVAALRAVGAHVLQLSGKGVPDLLVYFRGTWTPLEVKTPKAERMNGTLDPFTDAQRELMAKAPYPVVETPDAALLAIGAIGADYHKSSGLKLYGSS